MLQSSYGSFFRGEQGSNPGVQIEGAHASLNSLPQLLLNISGCRSLEALPVHLHDHARRAVATLGSMEGRKPSLDRRMALTKLTYKLLVTKLVANLFSSLVTTLITKLVAG